MAACSAHDVLHVTLCSYRGCGSYFDDQGLVVQGGLNGLHEFQVFMHRRCRVCNVPARHIMHKNPPTTFSRTRALFCLNNPLCLPPSNSRVHVQEEFVRLAKSVWRVVDRDYDMILG